MAHAARSLTISHPIKAAALDSISNCGTNKTSTFLFPLFLKLLQAHICVTFFSLDIIPAYRAAAAPRRAATKPKPRAPAVAAALGVLLVDLVEVGPE